MLGSKGKVYMNTSQIQLPLWVQRVGMHYLRPGAVIIVLRTWGGLQATFLRSPIGLEQTLTTLTSVTNLLTSLHEIAEST